ncbi:MAG: tetratricopeptide repeat protein, partial [Actinobacteria bacterium]|nr:tetratricopeptide repeat protein [Actinomycetota bacterium]
IAAAGSGGQVLLSETTRALAEPELEEGVVLRDLGAHWLKAHARPEHFFQLEITGLTTDFPVLRTLDVRKDNLPVQLTTFVGRDDEIETVSRLLDTARLLTLTGPGGVGKTRLALESGFGLMNQFGDGVWLVELEALTDPSLVARQVGSVFGIKDDPSLAVGQVKGRDMLDRVIEYLEAREVLLILDNSEHLVEACAELANAVLTSCPAVKILATSRERLGVPGESVFTVAPLELPEANVVDPEEIAHYESVELFMTRARAIQPALTLDPETARAAVQITRRLDGIPLALELAAAWTNTLPVSEIAARLDHRFQLLESGPRTTMPRHQTLRAAVDSSFELLTETEKLAFVTLSVFASAFSLKAAEYLLEGSDINRAETLKLVGRLVDQSLLTPANGDEVRFYMLNTLRSYGREHLEDRGCGVGRRHAEWFVELSEKTAPHLHGPEQRQWLDRLEADLDDLRAAIGWSLEHDVDLALRLAGALGWFWLMGGYRSEGRQHIETLLAVSEDTGSTDTRVQALVWAAILLCADQHQVRRARGYAKEAFELAQGTGNVRSRAMSATILAMLSRPAEATALLEETAADLDDVADPWILAIASMVRSTPALAVGDWAAVNRHAREALEGFTKAGDQWGRMVALEFQGFAAYAAGDMERAQGLLEEATGLARQDEPRVALYLAQLGNVAATIGDSERASSLYDESLMLSRRLGTTIDMVEAQLGQGLIARRLGQLEMAQQLYEDALNATRQSENPLGMALSLSGLGFVAELQGAFDEATLHHADALRLTEGVTEQMQGISFVAGPVSAIAIEGLAGASVRNDSEKAVRLLGAAHALRQDRGRTPFPHEQEDIDRARVAALSKLTQDAFDNAFEEGATINPDEALELALAD